MTTFELSCAIIWLMGALGGGAALWRYAVERRPSVPMCCGMALGLVVGHSEMFHEIQGLPFSAPLTRHTPTHRNLSVDEALCGT